MEKILKILTYVVLGITFVMTVIYFTNPDAQVGNFLFWSYLLFGAAVLLVVVFPLFNMAANPQGIKKMLRNLVLLVVVFGGAYLLSSSAQTLTTAAMATPPSPSALRMTDTGLYITYALCLIALLAIAASSVYTAVKNR